MKNAEILRFAFVFTFAIGCAANGQDSNKPHEYSVPNHGRLILTVPASLKEFNAPLSQPPSMQLRHHVAIAEVP